jgi:hypothetical protein
VGTNGGRVEDEGVNSGRVEDEGAWYEAEVEAQLLEDEGLRGRRYPSSPRKFTVCINYRLTPTIFCISVRIPSNVMWSIVVPTCWASRYTLEMCRTIKIRRIISTTKL